MTRNKFSSIFRIATFSSLFATVPLASAQEVFSQIVGAIAMDLPANSDVVVATPFNQTASFRGVAASASGGQINLSSDALTAGAFNETGGVATHYVLIESGTLQGQRIAIISNTASSLNLGGADLTGLAADDAISIVSYWTLGSAFPQGVAFHEETAPGNRELEVILTTQAAVGGGLQAKDVFYFYNGAWRKVGASKSESFNSQILEPSTAFVIRNNAAAKTSYFFGEVVTAPLAVPLQRSDSGLVDNFVSIERPLDISLIELGLHDSGVFEVTTDANNPTDQLLLYSLSSAGKNKQPTASYFFFNNAWRKVGADINTSFDSDVISAGMGIAIRKAQAVQSDQLTWVNQWELPQ